MSEFFWWAVISGGLVLVLYLLRWLCSPVTWMRIPLEDLRLAVVEDKIAKEHVEAMVSNRRIEKIRQESARREQQILEDIQSKIIEDRIERLKRGEHLHVTEPKPDPPGPIRRP